MSVKKTVRFNLPSRVRGKPKVKDLNKKRIVILNEVKNLNNILNQKQTPWRRALLCALMLIMLLPACEREPMLHLHDPANVNLDLPVVELELNVFWDYVNNLGIPYDWQEEWYYGWDDKDREIFGEMGYSKPDVFHLRRYFTGDIPLAPHTTVDAHIVHGYRYSGQFDFGYWDLLAWNDIETIDGIQSLDWDETTSLDYVTAFTNQTMHNSRYHAPRYTRSFYQPEALFSAYHAGLEINRNLEGFIYDPEANVWKRELEMILDPRTYIYLPQIILHNNKGKVTGVDGNGNLSGMARTCNLNTGIAGPDPISVHHYFRFKKDCDMKGELVDIIGGRLMTFGMCNINGSRVDAPVRGDDLEPSVDDGNHHYIDVNMQFSNGMDSTFVFDVTEIVRRRYKGGVITVELDMDTISAPTRPGGSGFDAVVKDYEDGGTHEFPI